MVDPTSRFSSRAEYYAKYRPRYPQEVLKTLQRECGLRANSIVADIGSGTGALTELFVQNGNPVLAVEPNHAMREMAERNLSRYAGFRSITGRAEATTLEDRSVDFIAVGQAFHWFDPASTRGEFLRILKPFGWVLVVWNEREFQTTPFLRAYDRLLQTYALDYAREKHKSVYDTALSDFYGPGGCVERIFRYTQEMDFEGVKGRMLSSSYNPEPGHPNYEPMVAELHDIFRSHEVDGRVAFEYITRMYFGRLNP